MGRGRPSCCSEPNAVFPQGVRQLAGIGHRLEHQSQRRIRRHLQLELQRVVPTYGYTLRDRSGHLYKFPTFTLRPRASVTVHTGRGTNTGTNLYWGSGSFIWNNTGDTAYLRNTVGTLKDSCSWGTVASYVYC